MKRAIIIILSVVLLVFFLLPSALMAEVNPTPSTNDANREKGWAHVNVIEVGPCEITLEFVSTRGFWSCFEYRTDGDTSQADGDNYNPDITDGLYPFVCVNNSTEQLTLNANEYVEVRMVFGAETDERFGWTRFDVESCAIPAGSLTVFKYSGDQPLAGAVFDVVNTEGFAAKITTGGNGIGTISGIDPGTYYVKEVAAPEGYELDPTQYTVTVPEGGSGRVDIANDPIPAPTPVVEEPPAEEVEVAGITEEIEVAGVSEELPYTGYNYIYYIIGFALLALAGISYGALRLARSKK